MATYLLFCTAVIPTTAIDRLMQSQEHNFFSLVKFPEQTTFDAPTPTPLAPFTTSFTNWTSKHIQDFVSEYLPDSVEGTTLEPSGYAILDEKSLPSDTVVLGHAYSPLLQRDIEGMTEDEREQWEENCDAYDADDRSDEQWAEWRVAFKDAEKVSTVLSFEQDFTSKMYNAEYVADFTDAEGVFDYQRAFQNYVRMSGARAGEQEEEED